MSGGHPTTEKRLDPALKAKWLEALRSGKYQQGRGGLRDENNCFCCLGVLMDIVDPTKWSPKAENQVESFHRAFYTYGDHEVEMPLDEKLDRLGINPSGAATQLACMNDGEDGDPQDFEAIAEWIEANL